MRRQEEKKRRRVRECREPTLWVFCWEDYWSRFVLWEVRGMSTTSCVCRRATSNLQSNSHISKHSVDNLTIFYVHEAYYNWVNKECLCIQCCVVVIIVGRLCLFTCVCACVLACVHACVCACVYVCVFTYSWRYMYSVGN